MAQCVYAASGSSVVLLNPLSGAVHSSVSPCPARALAVVEGDWVLATQRKEAAIYAVRRAQKSVHIKCRLPESLGPVATDGTFCYGGGVTGSLFVWELSSGLLLRTWHGHHKPVRCLGLTDDGSYLVSGGDDSVLTVWSTLDLVDDAGDGPIREYHSFSDHSQAITAVHVGHGGVRGRIFSSSLDRTVRVFEIFSKQVLFTVSLDSFVTSVVASSDESWLYAGTGDGTIVAIDLRESACAGAESINSGGYSRLDGHTQPVTGLICLDQGGSLVSSSEDGTCRAWDLFSKQCVQTTDLKASVTCIVPAGAFNASESRSAGPSEHDICPLVPLRKYPGQGRGGHLPLRRLQAHQHVDQQVPSKRSRP